MCELTHAGYNIRFCSLTHVLNMKKQPLKLTHVVFYSCLSVNSRMCIFETLIESEQNLLGEEHNSYICCRTQHKKRILVMWCAFVVYTHLLSIVY